MKRWLWICLALLALCGTAFADVAWEPENSFYARHQWQCRTEERVYWINGAEGYVTAREKPEGKPLADIKNGARRYVYGTYERDGALWGLVSISAVREPELLLAVSEELGDGYCEAWIPMSETVLYYDHQSFMEEFGGQVREESRSFSLGGLKYCNYEYPGGGLNFQQTRAAPPDVVDASMLYTDPEGREWGYCRYFYGDREVWFCLSDLENPDLQSTDHTPELIPAAEQAELPDWQDTSVWIAAAGVAAVCAVTALLLLWLRKRKNNE